MASLMDELLVGIGFDFDSEGGDEFKQQTEVVTSVISKVAVAAAVATTALLAMGAAALSISAAGDDIAKTGRQLNLTGAELAGFGKFLDIAGVGADKTAGILESLNAAAVQFAETGQGLDFQALSGIGVSPDIFLDLADGSKDAIEVFETLLSAMQRVDKSSGEFAAGAFGFDLRLLDANISLIKQSVVEARKLGVANKSLLDNSEKLRDVWTDTQFIMQGIADTFNVDFLGGAIESLERVNTALKKFADEGFSIFKIGFEDLLTPVTNLLKVVAALGKFAIGGGDKTLDELFKEGFDPDGTSTPTPIVEPESLAESFGMTDDEFFKASHAPIVDRSSKEFIAQLLRDMNAEELSKFGEVPMSGPFKGRVTNQSAGFINPTSANNINSSSSSSGSTQITNHHTYNGLNTNDIEALMRRQEREQIEFLSNDATDAISR